MSPRRSRPLHWHVARWGDEEFSRGSWTYIRPGGSPTDRWQLAEPIDGRFILCGEAMGTDQPAMTHGAYDSGCRAARWALAAGGRVIVVGAGLGGLGAARTMVEAGRECVVLEARARVGGRVHTVSLGESVRVDAGAAWLQQFPRNPFGELARSLGATLVPTDFHRPLAATAAGRVPDVAGAFSRLSAAAASAPRSESVADVVARLGVDDATRFAIDADVVLETGGPIDDTSARWFAGEEGVGNDDHWIVGGYQVVLDHLAAGLDIRLAEPVRSIEWSPDGVTVRTDAALYEADRCICNIPVSLLREGAAPLLAPGLPESHRTALARIGMGVVDKVLLRFAERWWPTPPHGYFRWYDTPASWCEWADLTDGCGAPVVAGLIAADAVPRHHAGRSDEAVALAATEALARWADAVRGLR
jgi:monoamine oxidase